MKNLIAFVGFKSSGKNTAAEALFPLGYTPFSFADSLKDAVASIFCWDRQLLEGITDESREWREQVDEWWANKLGIPHFTPRWMMQNFGTDIMRKTFHDNIWIANVERRISMVENAVITDVRFPNEVKMVNENGGYVIRVKRGPDPDWYDLAKKVNQPYPWPYYVEEFSKLKIHPSESAWIGQKFFNTIENNGTIEQLHDNVVMAEIMVHNS